MDSFTRHPLPLDDRPTSSQRSRNRDSMFLLARLTLGGGMPEDVRIRNLSEGGLMVDFDRPVDVGTAVVLDVRGIGQVTGKVAWHAAGRIGIALDARIDPKLARKPIGRGTGASGHAKPR